MFWYLVELAVKAIWVLGWVVPVLLVVAMRTTDERAIDRRRRQRGW